MSERIHAMVQHLLGKSSIEECSLEEIQHITKRYPFFAPAQFLLLQKLKAVGSPDAVAQHRKAVLYFHDPLQFNYFLSHAGDPIEEELLEEQETTYPTAQEAVVSTPELPAEAVTAPEELVAEAAGENPAIAQEEAAPLPAAAPVFEEPDIVREEKIEPATEPAVLPVEPLPEEPVKSPTGDKAEERPAIQAVSPAPVEATSPEPAETTATATGEEKNPAVISPITAQTTPAGDGMLFEPFHTVDYFASQGIKVTTDDFSKDKLSKQLRSFTEWLKIMKRLPAADIAQKPPSSAEKNVEHMASHSVEGSEVVTETMAEVWAKQGAREKAIETYNKLSLQNPSKKAYFAAKIENLKGS